MLSLFPTRACYVKQPEAMFSNHSKSHFTLFCSFWGESCIVTHNFKSTNFIFDSSLEKKSHAKPAPNFHLEHSKNWYLISTYSLLGHSKHFQPFTKLNCREGLCGLCFYVSQENSETNKWPNWWQSHTEWTDEGTWLHPELPCHLLSVMLQLLHTEVTPYQVWMTSHQHFCLCILFLFPQVLGNTWNKTIKAMLKRMNAK